MYVPDIFVSLHSCLQIISEKFFSYGFLLPFVRKDN